MHFGLITQKWLIQTATLHTAYAPEAIHLPTKHKL